MEETRWTRYRTRRCCCSRSIVDGEYVVEDDDVPTEIHLSCATVDICDEAVGITALTDVDFVQVYHIL